MTVTVRDDDAEREDDAEQEEDAERNEDCPNLKMNGAQVIFIFILPFYLHSDILMNISLPCHYHIHECMIVMMMV